jgi:hypothetical protein
MSARDRAIRSARLMPVTSGSTREAANGPSLASTAARASGRMASISSDHKRSLVMASSEQRSRQSLQAAMRSPPVVAREEP